MLKERLKEDLKSAMKSGDSERRSVIGMILAAIQSKEIEKRTALSKSTSDVSELETKSKLSDEDVVSVIQTEVKKRKESAETFEKGGRPELAEGARKEITILMAYLPEQMPEDEVKKEAIAAISETGASSIKDIGKVMSAVMEKVKGRTDGQTVSRLAKEVLAK